MYNVKQSNNEVVIYNLVGELFNSNAEWKKYQHFFNYRPFRVKSVIFGALNDNKIIITRHRLGDRVNIDTIKNLAFVNLSFSNYSSKKDNDELIDNVNNNVCQVPQIINLNNVGISRIPNKEEEEHREDSTVRIHGSYDQEYDSISLD